MVSLSVCSVEKIFNFYSFCLISSMVKICEDVFFMAAEPELSKTLVNRHDVETNIFMHESGIGKYTSYFFVKAKQVESRESRHLEGTWVQKQVGRD